MGSNDKVAKGKLPDLGEKRASERNRTSDLLITNQGADSIFTPVIWGSQ